MPELIPPFGYTIDVANGSEPSLVDTTGKKRNVRITNRNLRKLDELFDGNLIQLINELENQNSGRRPFRVLDCVAGSDSRAARDLSSRNPDMEIYSIDFLTRKAVGPKNTQLIKGDAYRLPIISGSIDFAYSYGFFYYLEQEHRFSEMNSAMAEIARVLVPGGKALVCAEYGSFQRNNNRGGRFELETGTRIKPVQCGHLLRGPLNIFTRLDILFNRGRWPDDRYIVMQKLPATPEVDLHFIPA